MEVYHVDTHEQMCISANLIAVNALEIRETAVRHRLDALFEVLSSAQPVLLDELALGGGLDRELLLAVAVRTHALSERLPECPATSARPLGKGGDPAARPRLRPSGSKWLYP
jgi:hypothetical protein